PFGPRKANSSPGATARDRLSTASLVPYRLVTLVSSITNRSREAGPSLPLQHERLAVPAGLLADDPAVREVHPGPGPEVVGLEDDHPTGKRLPLVGQVVQLGLHLG